MVLMSRIGKETARGRNNNSYTYDNWWHTSFVWRDSTCSISTNNKSD